MFLLEPPPHPLIFEPRRWFGGGCDLTPSYIHEEDCREFHQFWRTLCDGHCEGLYAEYKEWCDRYFYISARKEHRGVGGIFFDDLESADTRLDAQKFVEVSRRALAGDRVRGRALGRRRATESARAWLTERVCCAIDNDAH